MDLASLKNIDLKDIVAKLKSGGIADKKLLIQFGVGFGAILIFLIGYYAFVSPRVEAQKADINLMNENKNKIEEFKNNIGTLKASVKKLEPEYNKNSKLFHSKKEVEDLYDNLSTYAEANGLVISNIEKKPPVPVYKGKSAKKKKKKKNKSNIAYYNIPVKYEVQGNFLAYLKFKRLLSKSKKMINFDKESIKVIKGDSTGAISATGTLTIVGLTDEFS